MKQYLKIAFRNTIRQKKRSLLLGGAIAFGIFIITLLNGFTGGLQVTIKNNFSNAFGGHIYITGSQVNDRNKIIPVINNSDELLQSIQSIEQDIKSVSKRSAASGTLIFGTKEFRQKIEGINLAEEKDFSSAFAVLDGSIADLSKPDSIMLPDETARTLGIQVGETLLFRTVTGTGQQNVGEFVLAATFADQSGFGLTSGYTNLYSLNELIGLPEHSYQTLNIFLKNMEDIDIVSERLYREMQSRLIVEGRDTADTAEEEDVHHMGANLMRMMGIQTVKEVDPADTWEGTKYSITTLNDFTDQIMSLIDVLNVIGFIIFVVLMIITMVGIMNSFRMVMIERTHEIGAMRAMGVQKSNVRNIFLFEALIIALLGAAAGLLLALLVGAILGVISFGTGSFLTLFLNKGYLNLIFPASEILHNIITVSMLSLVAVWLPAHAAAKLKPAVALHTSY